MRKVIISIHVLTTGVLVLTTQ